MLKEAKKRCDSAELFSLEERTDRVKFENGKLKEIESSVSDGYSLRMIRGSRIGFSFTTNLKEKLIDNCCESMSAEAHFSFPKTSDVKKMEMDFSPVDNEEIVKECERILDELKVEGQINVYAESSLQDITVSNTEGTDLSQRSFSFGIAPFIYYPESTAVIYREFISKRFERYPEEDIEFLRELWRAGKEKVDLTPGKEALFLPETVQSLLLSFVVGTNGKSVLKKESSISEMIGNEIFNQKVSIYNDPLDDRFAGARGFDDEGVPCRKLSLVEKGVLKSFYYDLEWAGRAGVEPTGNGMKRGVSSKPEPQLRNLFVTPGSLSFDEMVRDMDDGIIVCGTLGDLSGNLYRGDFSMGVAPALVVKKGEIKGRAKDLMVSGNLYEAMKSVIAIENELHPTLDGNFPAILLGEAKVHPS